MGFEFAARWTSSLPEHLPRKRLPRERRRLGLEQDVRDRAIRHAADAQGHDVQLRADVEVVQPQDLLPRGDGARAVGELLRGRAGEGLPAQGVHGEVAEGPFGGAQVVEGLQEGGQVGAQHAGHHEGEGEDDGGSADGEARVVEEGVEDDAEALAAAEEAEAVVRLQEQHRRRAREAHSHGGEDGEDEAGNDLERQLQERVLQQEGFYRISSIAVLGVEELNGVR